MKIGVIITHYGEVEVTLKCFRSVERCCYSDRNIYIVDNDPKNRFTSEVAAKVLVNGKNQGYAGAINRAVKQGISENCDAFLILNNDLIIKNEDFLSSAARHYAENKNIGMIGPMVVNPNNGRVISAGEKVSYKLLFELYRYKKLEHLTDVDFINGSAMFIPRKVFEKVGLFDEDYFLYVEEVDFGFRVKRAGFRIVAVPDMVVLHERGAEKKSNRAQVEYYKARNMMLFIKKNIHGWDTIPAYVFYYLRALKRLCLCFLGRDYSSMRLLLRGMLAGVRWQR